MKATELRIGNLFDNHGAICHVMAIKINSAEFGYFEDSVGFERRFDNEIILPNPIPLTEEWISKLGFDDGILHFAKTLTYNNYTQILRVNHKEKYTVDFIVIKGKRKAVSYINGISKIQYVHQLQNLYFALTGQELEIKKVA